MQARDGCKLGMGAGKGWGCRLEIEIQAWDGVQARNGCRLVVG